MEKSAYYQLSARALSQCLLPLVAAFTHLPHEAGDLDDLDGVELFEVEEMRVPGDDVLGMALQGAGQKLVVGRVHGEAVSGVQVLGEDGLAEHQMHEAAQPHLRRGKALADMG